MRRPAARILLRKALFRSLAEKPTPLHEPPAERPGMVLVRSDRNPGVRRWRSTSKQAQAFHGEKARLVLHEAFEGGGTVLLTRARLEDPEVRALVDQGLLEIHQEPRHHAHEFRGVLTKAGREHVRRERENRARLAQEAQTPMFKASARIVLRKGQIGLFAGTHPLPEVEHAAPATPTEVPAGVVHVAEHTQHNPGGGVHVVRAHEERRYRHVFDHLGKPPYSYLGHKYVVHRAVQGAPVQPGGTCDHCGTAIHDQFHFLSADGKRFKVGSDCVEKSGDRGLKRVIADDVRKHRREQAQARQHTIIDAGLEALDQHHARFAEMPHPAEWGQNAGLSRLDWIDWMLANAGSAGREKVARFVLDTLGHRPPGRRIALAKAADGGVGGTARRGPPGVGPGARGLQLIQSRSNPRVRRWEQTKQEPAKPPSDHIRFRHPDTGEERTGQVIAGGAKGVTVVDHETGTTAKVHHGHYVVSDPPAKPKGEGSPRPRSTVGSGRTGHVGTGMVPRIGGAAPDAPRYRETHPGLNKYPPPDVKAEEGGDGDDWKLRWRSPATGKMVQAYETSYLRENAREKFRRINQVGARLPELRSTLDTHMGLHPETPAAVKATMVRMVDHTAMRAGNEDSAGKGVHGVSTLLKKHARVEGNHVHLDYVGKSSVPQSHTVDDPKVAAVVRHLLTLPGDRLFQAQDGRGGHAPVTADQLNDYVREHLGADHTLKDLRTFHATRIFSEAADKLGAPKGSEDAETKIHAAALDVAKHLGHKKASTRAHFAVHDEGDSPDHAQVETHSGKLYMHGPRRVVGFHTAADRKGYLAQAGDKAKVLPKGEHPDVGSEWLHEGQTSLDNYIDPTVIEAYRKGLTLSGSMRKAAEASTDGLTADEVRFVHHLRKVAEMDPYKFRGGQP